MGSVLLAAALTALVSCGGRDSPPRAAATTPAPSAAAPTRPAAPTTTPAQLLERVTGYRLVDDAKLTADVRAELGDQPDMKALAVRALVSRRGDYVGFVQVLQRKRAQAPHELNQDRTMAVGYGVQNGDGREVVLGEVRAAEISFPQGKFRKRWYLPTEHYSVTITGKDAVATEVAKQLATAISQAA